MDLRNQGALLGTYSNAHTDDVTRLVFHPTKNNFLLSGSEDGLVASFDTTQPTEEMAIQSVLNVGSPIRRMGFCGFEPTESTVWCLTGSETASLWNLDTASCICDFGALSLREQLSMHYSSGMMGGHIDYLIDAHWDTSSRELFLSAGNAQGEAALFQCTNSTNNNMTQQHMGSSTPSYTWQPCHWLKGGHRGVVRGVVHVSPSILISAGEDARMCEWNRLGNQAHSATTSAVSTASNTAHTNNGMVRKSSSSSGIMIASDSVVQSHRSGGGPLRRQRNRTLAAPY